MNVAGSLDSNGCDIENSFVLNLRLKHAMECRLCVSCGTSTIEIEERYRMSEKHKRKEGIAVKIDELELPEPYWFKRGMHNFLYRKKSDRSLSIHASNNA